MNTTPPTHPMISFAESRIAKVSLDKYQNLKITIEVKKEDYTESQRKILSEYWEFGNLTVCAIQEQETQ